jgi:phage-related protein
MFNGVSFQQSIMLCWTLFGLITAVSAYSRGRQIIKTEFEDLGISYRGLVGSRTFRLYRKGNDAIMVGKFLKWCSLVLLLVTILDLLLGTAYVIYAFFITTLIYGVILEFLCPVQKQPIYHPFASKPVQPPRNANHD